MNFSDPLLYGSGLNSTDDWLEAADANDSNVSSTGLPWPCRSPPYSTNTTTPLVWTILPPQLYEARIYVAVVEAVLFLVGFCWNSFVVLSYCIKWKLLREPANIYLFNLAIIDLLLTVFIILTCVITEASGEFVFGASDYVRCHFCEILGMILHTFISLTLHTLTALSVDRCVLLSQPIKYKQIFTWQRALAIQISLWVISILISIPPLLGFGEYEYNVALGSCNARWTGVGRRGIENINYVIFFGVEAIIPIIILTVTNIYVIKIAKGFLKKRITRRRTYRGDNKDSNMQEEKQYKQQQSQLVRVFGALFVAHIVCWTPVLTITFVSVGIGAHNLPVELFLVSWLTYLCIPVVHPILESFFVKDLRSSIDKYKKSVGSSLSRAGGSLYSQVSSSSLLKGKSALALTVPVSSDKKRQLTRRPHSTTCILSLDATMKNGLAPCDFIPSSASTTHSSPEEPRKHLPLRHSTVSFKLDEKCPTPDPCLFPKQRRPSLFGVSEISSDDVFCPIPAPPGPGNDDDVGKDVGSMA